MVFGGVAALAFAIDAIAWEPLRSHRGELIALVFLVSGVHFAGRQGLAPSGLELGGILIPPEAAEATEATEGSPSAGPLGLWDLGRALKDAAPSALRETTLALLLAAAIFPPFAAGFYLFHQPERAFSLAGLSAFGGPLAWLELLAAQLLVVALPEETFFRGYVQSRLADAETPHDSRLVAPAVVVAQAALFALIHLVADPRPARLMVFFPGLLFGLIRARRGGIGAALVFHALCNVLSEFLTRGWFS